MKQQCSATNVQRSKREISNLAIATKAALVIEEHQSVERAVILLFFA
jgi:hypothetical protein